MPVPTVLIVDDERSILTSLSRMLQLEDFRPITAGGGKEALARVGDADVDVVMLDVKMPDIGGLEVLQALKQQKPDLPVIMMSGHSDIETAIRAIHLGAHDFIEKPLSSDKILITLRNALRFRSLSQENRTLRREVSERHRLVGGSAPMRRLEDLVDRAAPTNGTVLVTGESGTGKELIARAIHLRSKRSGKAFVKLNCAAIPRELIESELFGHEKGAFTGASQMKRGKFELADGGTLFLDEIGDMKLEAQAKLLRVLQEGEFERVGGQGEIMVDVRVIAATNKDLQEEIATGRFREDLFYRINVIPIRAPSLREHREDISDLVHHFVAAACRDNGWREKLVSDEAMRLLQATDYPGNVRELRNTCERLVILSPGAGIEVDDVRALAAPSRPRARAGYTPGVPLKELVDGAERDFIQAALEAYGGNMTRTAESLGLERSHLYKKMRALGLREAP